MFKFINSQLIISIVNSTIDNEAAIRKSRLAFALFYLHNNLATVSCSTQMLHETLWWSGKSQTTSDKRNICKYAKRCANLWFWKYLIYKLTQRVGNLNSRQFWSFLIKDTRSLINQWFSCLLANSLSIALLILDDFPRKTRNLQKTSNKSVVDDKTRQTSSEICESYGFDIVKVAFIVRRARNAFCATQRSVIEQFKRRVPTKTAHI